MQVKTFKINTTKGSRYGLMTKDNQVLPNAGAKWKTEKGVVNYANKRGFSIVNKGRGK